MLEYQKYFKYSNPSPNDKFGCTYHDWRDETPVGANLVFALVLALALVHLRFTNRTTTNKGDHKDRPYGMTVA